MTRTANKITGANAGGRRQLPIRTRWAARVAQFRHSSGTRSRNRKILDKAGVILENQGNAVRPAAQAATWSGGPDGVASGCQGRLVAAGLSDARVQGKGSLATLGSCLKNPAVDLANVLLTGNGRRR